MNSSKPWCLTNHLLSLTPDQYIHATQSPFLYLAAHGKVSKLILSEWLANDRLYIHAYIKGTGGFLRGLHLPESSSIPGPSDAVETKLLDWMIEALANVRREERFFVDVAEKYGLNLSLRERNSLTVKSEALRQFETIFSRVSSNVEAAKLPWLEGAVVFWATEKCYLEAWSWAKEQMPGSSASKDVAMDEDGGALRKEFIPNWSSPDFVKFVNQLAEIIDEGVNEALRSASSVEELEDWREKFGTRAEMRWKEVLDAEMAFWPNVSDFKE